MKIRPFSPEDAEAVREVHLRAFDGRSEEPRIVELLHAGDKAPVSLVAVLDGSVVAHVLFSPVDLGEGGSSINMVALAPVAVLPEHQNQGIGSNLIRAGLEVCREADYDAVVLLGEPSYYSRFGFERASDYGLGNEYGVDEHFMVAPLKSGALDGASGTVRYEPDFREGFRKRVE
jgi:putative acetyltransferase